MHLDQDGYFDTMKNLPFGNEESVGNPFVMLAHKYGYRVVRNRPRVHGLESASLSAVGVALLYSVPAGVFAA